jgi:hypothetical protein
VKITQGVSQLTLYRMLVAALVYDQGGLSLEETIALFDLQGRLEKKLGSDPQFTEMYGSSLETVNAQLRKVRFQSFPIQTLSGWKTETAGLLAGFLPGPNDYYGWSRNPKRRLAVRIIVPNPLKPPKKRPQKRVIGVGYKDSGNRRDIAKDGVGVRELMKADPSQISKPGNSLKEALIGLIRESEKNPSPRGRG